MAKKTKVKKKEKYFICPSCGILQTESEILKDVRMSGSVGMCYCQFSTQYWDEKINDFDVDTPRIFVDFIEIKKEMYEGLRKQINTALRLQMFRTIPKGKLK